METETETINIVFNKTPSYVTKAQKAYYLRKKENNPDKLKQYNHEQYIKKKNKKNNIEFVEEFNRLNTISYFVFIK